MKKKIFLLILSVMLLCGCSRQPSANPKVITKVTISGDNISEKTYTSPEKIQRFLAYFRNLSDRPLSGQESPAPNPAAYDIVLQYQDGSRIAWTQSEDTYLRRNGEFWKFLRPEQGRRLRMLLTVIPEDKN